MMGMGSGGSDGTSLAALLEVVSDPEAAKTKLAEFNAKIEQAKVIMEQAKAVNDENARMVKDIRAKTDEAFAAQAVKEVELARRESILASNLSSIEGAKKELAELGSRVASDQQNVNQRKRDLERAEQDLLDRAAKATADHEAAVKARKATLDAEHSTRMSAAKKAMDEAIAKDKLATATAIEAEQKKQLYEKRLAVLQETVKVMQGD